MRLIDADALKEDLKLPEESGRMGELLGMVIDAVIEDAPTIEERKTGEWCFTPDGQLVCSNCYEKPTNRIFIHGDMVFDMTPIREMMKFCPNCGADMREGGGRG